MNIFVLHTNPASAARMHCDKHVVKMIVEYAQILCYVHQSYDPVKSKRAGLYPATKSNLSNPCTRWTAENTTNYRWVYNLLVALLAEYEHRFKPSEPKFVRTRQMLKPLGIPPRGMPSIKCTLPVDFVLVMGATPECITSNAVDAYRRLYRIHKARFCKWTNRKVPKWWSTPLSSKLTTLRATAVLYI